jgi:hypothetical protein
MRKLRFAALTFLVFLPNLIVAQQPPTSIDQPFLLLSSNETKKLQVRLSDAAKTGYRVLALLSIVGYENLIFLEKSSQPEPVEYLLLGISRIPTTQKELNQGAAQGFRLLPGTLAVTGELVAIMEKRPGVEQRYEYRVIDAMRAKSMEKGIQQTFDQGWQMCWLYRPAMQNLAIFERPAGSLAPTGKPPEIKDADMRFRLFSPRSHDSFSNELAALATQGHRVVMAPRQVNSASVLVEKMAEGTPQSGYLVIKPKDKKELEDALSKANADGFRLRWPTMLYASEYGYGAQVFLIAEKTPGAPGRCEYLMLGWAATASITPELSEKLSQALAGGFKARDGVVWGGDRLLFLEKCGP